MYQSMLVWYINSIHAGPFVFGTYCVVSYLHKWSIDCFRRLFIILIEILIMITLVSMRFIFMSIIVFCTSQTSSLLYRYCFQWRIQGTWTPNGEKFPHISAPKMDNIRVKLVAGPPKRKWPNLDMKKQTRTM